MKTWILKGDLSYSPQAAFRIYACGVRKAKPIDNPQTQSCFLVNKIKAQLKSLLKLLEPSREVAPL